MLSHHRFGFPQMSNDWWLTLHGVVLGVGLLIGAFPQFVNGLECYNCIHATAGTFPESLIEQYLPGKVNRDCIDPYDSSNINPVPKINCTDPNESCMKGYAGGVVPSFGNLPIGILVRQCFVPSSGQPVADTCVDYDGKISGSTQTINWGTGSRSLPRILTETLEGLHKAVANETNATNAQEGKQLFPDVDVNGTYCLCKSKDLCNDAAGMEVINTNPTTTTTTPPPPSKDRSSPLHKVGMEQIIFGLIIPIIIRPLSVLSIF